ncbi:MAG: pyruvate dehydrogenase complex dihydrolipoamide acetyltransferase [Maricaulis sp.]|jgi:pyruvate dehydrogenase E2 component (dihydrolipoamide acetyltransferase)|nr:pyruvate dehydrogenase complex dihydrolipoamide acetyltransferase [Maricaulis sp.]HAQ36511.1 pyruvate dehydrogenase complex dihydrolipoamide acetyltransferase [Alphaproteobacteria bacterium]
MPIEVLMPALSPTMEEGTLSKWLVKQGDTVASGDLIAEIETDKATMEVEAVDEGTVGKILVEEGSEGVKVNAVIALLLEEGEDKGALEGHKPEAASPPQSTSKDADSAPASGAGKKDAEPASSPVEAANEREAAGGKSSTNNSGNRIKASPLAKRMAEQAGIDLSRVKGSGPNGRIVKRDVEGAGQGAGKAAATQSAPQEAAQSATVDADDPLAKAGIARDRYEIEKADNITKISAKRLTDSFRDVPHFPLNVDCRLDALLAFRKQINDKAPDGVKVSVNDILIKAAGVALKQVPEANSSWIEDGRIARHKHADVSVAVAIEGGLITPIIRDADAKGLVQISKEMKDLAGRARDRKLKPEEFQGGTFSLSNLGMFGIKSFASILNPPQGMILSVGAGEERPVITDGALAKATVMTVTLTCDHRVVDGATGARWIAAFKGFIEDPMTLLM